MRKHNMSLLWLSIITLSACKVTKDSVAPHPDLPTTFRSSTTADTASSIADISWKEFFSDPVLQKLIDTAIVRNYDMQLAVKNIEIADLLLRQSKWGYAPDVSLQASASTLRPSDNSLNGISLKQFLGKPHIEDYTAAVGVTWEADIWGKVRNQKGAALANYLQTAEAKKALQTRVVADIAQGYYNLLLLDAQIEVANKNLALNDSTLHIIRLQFNAGQVTALGVQQAEAQRLIAAQLIPELQQYILVQENALSVLTGQLPDKKERTVTLRDMVIPAALSAGYPAAILRRRPDIRSSELQLVVANAQVGIAKANLYPALQITAGGGINAFRVSNWFNVPAALFGSVAGGITQPLFQKKQLQTQYKVAQVQREETVIRFRQTVLTAVAEVSDALAQTTQLSSRYQVATDKVQTLQIAVSNAGQLFKNGLANYLEVITAQANLLQSELEVNAIKQQQLVAAVDLYRALGGGWK